METLFVERLGEKDGVWSWWPEAIEIDTAGDFEIDERELNTELCRTGKLLLKYGDLAADLGSELERKKEAVKLLAASLGGMHRSAMELKGDRVTEAKLNEAVLTDDKYTTALNALHVVRASAVKSDHWFRSMNAKAKLLESLAFRQGAEIRRGYQ